MCFVFSVSSSRSENGNIRSPATFPSAMPFAANPFTGIRQTYIPPSLFQAHVPHFQQPPLLPSILQGSSNGSVSVVLTDAEVRAIFFNDPRDRQRQVWHVDKMLRHSTAKCACCTRIQMLPGVLHVKVSGLWIPRGRRAAIERMFYLCAHPNCLTRKPPLSNLRVPPSEIHVSVNRFLDEIMTLLFSRKDAYHLHFHCKIYFKLSQNTFFSNSPGNEERRKKEENYK